MSKQNSKNKVIINPVVKGNNNHITIIVSLDKAEDLVKNNLAKSSEEDVEVKELSGFLSMTISLIYNIAYHAVQIFSLII